MKYPAYYEGGIRKLTDKDLADEDKYWQNNWHGIVYEGINVAMVLAFLATKKTKWNVKASTHVDISKYHDAIVFGAKKAGGDKPLLSEQYFTEIGDSLIMQVCCRGSKT